MKKQTKTKTKVKVKAKSKKVVATKKSKKQNKKTVHEIRMANLSLGMFKKGQSGNPKGRKKGQRDHATIYKNALTKIGEANDMTFEEMEEFMESVGLNRAFRGDFQFFKDIRDRVHGRAVQRTELTGADGEKLFENEHKEKSKSAIKGLISRRDTRRG